MKNAILVSLALHVAAGFVSTIAVRFSQVRFVPREVYSVQLVDPSQLPRPVQEKPKPAEAQTTAGNAKPQKPEDLVAPKRKHRKPPKKKTPRRVERIPEEVPRTNPDPVLDDTDGEAPPVATGDMQLSVEDFPFAYYLMSVKRKIAAYWKVPAAPAAQEKFCRVYFRVERNGTIRSPSIEQSSGNFLFDQAALRAVTQASPLPPLPGGFSDDYLGVHFSFAFEKESE